MRSYLDALIGNEALRERLGASAECGRISHAFLIEGGRGTGKHTLARELASALNCENKGSAQLPLPCHRCNTCRRIAEGSFTDVKYLKKAKDKATIGIGEVTLFKEDMYLSATESDYKIYVIENAELMTPQAQNSLLIALEEPPQNVIIMLLCEEGDKLLTTIKSRTQHIAMSRFSPEELEKNVAAMSRAASAMKSTDPLGYRGLILSADGSIGRALELLTPKLALKSKEKRELTEKLIRSMTAKASYSEIISAVGELSQKRAELNSELEALILALRDIISLKAHSGAPALFFTSDDELSELSRQFDSKRLFALYDIVCKACEDNQKNANVTTLITNLAVSIKNCR